MVAAAGGTFQIRHGEVVGADDGTQITLHVVQAVRVARAVVVGVPVDDDHALAGDLGRAVRLREVRQRHASPFSVFLFQLRATLPSAGTYTPVSPPMRLARASRPGPCRSAPTWTGPWPGWRRGPRALLGPAHIGRQHRLHGLAVRGEHRLAFDHQSELPLARPVLSPVRLMKERPYLRPLPRYGLSADTVKPFSTSSFMANNSSSPRPVRCRWTRLDPACIRRPTGSRWSAAARPRRGGCPTSRPSGRTRPAGGRQ